MAKLHDGHKHTRATFSSNQESNQNESFSRVLDRLHVLLRVLIGSLDCLCAL